MENWDFLPDFAGTSGICCILRGGTNSVYLSLTYGFEGWVFGTTAASVAISQALGDRTYRCSICWGLEHTCNYIGRHNLQYTGKKIWIMASLIRHSLSLNWYGHLLHQNNVELLRMRKAYQIAPTTTGWRTSGPLSWPPRTHRRYSPIRKVACNKAKIGHVDEAHTSWVRIKHSFQVMKST